MSAKPIHDTFKIERLLRANRKQTFDAWSRADLKAKWFVGPAGRWTAVRREMDFTVGGKEVVRGNFPDGDTSHFESVYLDIVDQERIIYAYRMYVSDSLLSISLATIDFEDNGTGCKVTLTEQGVFFGTHEDAVGRLQGTNMLVDNLTSFLEAN